MGKLKKVNFVSSWAVTRWLSIHLAVFSVTVVIGKHRRTHSRHKHRAKHKYAWHLSLSHTPIVTHYTQTSLRHTKRNTPQSLSGNILTDKKAVLSLRCPRSSPKGVQPPNYLPLSLHLCGPRLQRPTINRQRIGSVRGRRQTLQREEYSERHWTSGQQIHVRALLCLYYTTLKGWKVHPVLLPLYKGLVAFRDC